MLRRVVRLATKTRIQAYTEKGARDKLAFISGCEAVAHELVRLLGLPDGSYKIRTNLGGAAVSGDVHLHGERIYVALEQSCLNFTGFYYRKCQGRKDYCGGRNCWVHWGRIMDLPALASEMKKEMES
jgi:hypothetical protein